MSFKGFNYWSGFGSDYKTQYEPIFNEDIATRNVLFEKTYVPKLIITSTPISTGGFNFVKNLWMPTSIIDTPKIYPIGTVEGLSVNTGKVLTSNGYGDLCWGDYPEETYWKKQLDSGNVATRIVIFEKYNPHDFHFQSVEVVAGTRAIRATWTPELAQDLAAFQSIDAEAELTAMLSAEIAREIDKEIVSGLIAEITGRHVATRTVFVEKTTRFKTVLFPQINRLFS
jgi:hypothetical protein